MGKTRRRLKWSRKSCEAPDWERKVEQPEVVTYDWALGKLDSHIELWLETMISCGMIALADKYEWKGLVQRRVMHAVDLYDPTRIGENGRTASALNYITCAVENTFANIAETINRKARTEVPISSLPGSEADAAGMISEEDERLSDGCRGIKRLWLRMDVAVLSRMLTPRERHVVRRRIEGATNVEIADELYILRQTVERTILPKIQDKARKCGFFPRYETEMGRGL